MNPIEILAVNRTGFDTECIPFTQGIPFGKNVLPVNARVELVDADGNNVPLQTEVLATWTPRRLWVKWLLLDFALAQKAGEETRLTVRLADQRASEQMRGVTISKTPSELIVDTGKLEVRFSRTALHLPRLGFANPSSGPLHVEKSVFCIVDNEGREYHAGNDPDDYEIDVLSDGPIHAQVRQSGWYADRAGTRFCKLLATYHVYAEAPFVRVEHTLIYTEDHLQQWIKGFGVTVRSPAGFAGPFRVGVDRESATASKPILVRQLDDETVALCGRTRAGRSDGWGAVAGPGWVLGAGIRNTWQEYPKGIRAGDDGLELQFWPVDDDRDMTFDREIVMHPSIILALQRKERADDDLIDLIEADPERPLEVGYAETWMTADSLIDDLTERYGTTRRWTGSGHYGTPIQPRGTSKTTEFFIAAVREPDAERIPAIAAFLQQRPRALPSAEYMCATAVMGPLRHRDPENFPELETAFDNVFHYHMAIERKARLYGMFDYGDRPNWHIMRGYGRAFEKVGYKAADIARFCGWAGNATETLGGMPYALWVHFFRTSDSDVFDAAETRMMHARDVDQCHYRWPGAHESVIGMSHNVGVSHWSTPSWRCGRTCHTDYLLTHYYLTGDRRSLEVARAVGHHAFAHEMPRGSGQVWHCDNREITAALIGMTGLYEATWEKRYLEFAVRLFHRLLARVREKGAVYNELLYAEKTWVPDNFCSMGHLHVALMRYYRLTKDPMARGIMMRLADEGRTRPDSTWAMHPLHALGEAYYLTGDRVYIDLLQMKLKTMKPHFMPRCDDPCRWFDLAHRLGFAFAAGQALTKMLYDARHGTAPAHYPFEGPFEAMRNVEETHDKHTSFNAYESDAQRLGQHWKLYRAQAAPNRIPGRLIARVHGRSPLKIGIIGDDKALIPDGGHLWFQSFDLQPSLLDALRDLAGLDDVEIRTMPVKRHAHKVPGLEPIAQGTRTAVDHAAAFLIEKFDLVILIFGLMDCRDDGSVRLPEFEANLRRLVAHVRASGAEPLLLTPPEIFYGGNGSFEEKTRLVLIRYGAAVQEVAEREDTGCIDFYGMFRACLFSDALLFRSLKIENGMHTNTAGYRVMSEEIVRALFP